MKVKTYLYIEKVCNSMKGKDKLQINRTISNWWQRSASNEEHVLVANSYKNQQPFKNVSVYKEECYTYKNVV